MFCIRQGCHAIVRRVYVSVSHRYLSNTTSKFDSSSSSDGTTKSPDTSTSWASSETNDLVKQLAARIKGTGPLTVAEFMRESLLNPQHGYYTRHEVFGKKGDFITAPEISQIFGELLAVWVMYEHSTNGGTDLQLVELGPGRGTLMNDIIRVLRKRTYPYAHTCFALYEASALMRRRQAETLLQRSFDPVISEEYRLPEGNYSLRWIDDLKQLHPRNTYFITNELFDAYPIHKFQKTPQGWREVLIDWNPTTKRLQYVLSSRQTTMSRLYDSLLNSIEDRQHVEISPQSSVMMQAICKHIATHGGSALIGDYGHWGEKEDTFRGFRKHQVVDALSDPGNIDVTADVDFEQLALSGGQIANVHFYGPVSQRNFLYNLGIDIRASKLAYKKTAAEQKDILSAVEKLVSPEHMGERFLYLCVQNSKNKHAPAGFAAMPSYFVNDVSSCVDESLTGYVRAHSHLELVGRAVIARSQVPSVAIISGSGSGHEPATAGFVGRGLLNACISGSIFASPPSSDIFRLIIEMKRRGAKQVLLIILNYTGDRLNFGLAMERARELSIDIDMLVVADDAAVDSAIGPRGLAGLLLVIKVAGALAEQGKTMSEIVDVCQVLRGQLRTIGLSASGIRVPGQVQSFELLDDEMELGMGIHGEMGAQKLKLLPSRQATDLAFGQLFRGTRALHIKRDDNVLLLVNNLGGCSNLEFGVIIKDAIENLEHRALHVKRVICGEMMTSFNMKGFSLTVLKLTTEMSATILSLLDAPTDAFAWPKAISTTQLPTSIQTLSDSLEFNDQFTAQLQINQSDVVLEPAMSDLVEQALQTTVKRLNNEVDKLNRLDAISGDGDTGTAFARAADTITHDLTNGKLTLDRPSFLFRRLGLIAESRMGGTCGAICGLFFAAVAKNLSLSLGTGTIIDRLSDAFETGIQSVESYARVQPGDKSLLDALIPAVDFVKSKRPQQGFTSQDWKELAVVAERAAQETKTLVAKVGRASYTKAIDTPAIDPGAYAVSIILQAISDVFAKASAH